MALAQKWGVLELQRLNGEMKSKEPKKRDSLESPDFKRQSRTNRKNPLQNRPETALASGLIGEIKRGEAGFRMFGQKPASPRPPFKRNPAAGIGSGTG